MDNNCPLQGQDLTRVKRGGPRTQENVLVPEMQITVILKPPSCKQNGGASLNGMAPANVREDYILLYRQPSQQMLLMALEFLLPSC